MSKKKIFILINSLEWWGAERVVTVVSEQLSNDFDVTIVTLKDINFYDLPASIRYLPLSKVKNNLLMFLLIPYFVFQFKKLLKKENFLSWFSSLEISNFVNILSNKKAIIAFETNLNLFQGVTWFFYTLLIGWLYPQAKTIKVNSEENRYDVSKRLGIPLSKIKTIYNPINIDKIAVQIKEKVDEELTKQLEWKRVFVTVWRLIASKYHSMIITSFKEIYSTLDKDFIYLIVWDGLERQVLESQVKDMWLQENVVFLWAQKNVFKYLQVSHYFIYASQIEWFPNVLVEAMACNLPIITSDFKTGAKEAIFWEYNEKLFSDGEKMVYPCYGENGVLIRLEDYVKDFIEVYKNLDRVKQEKKWFEKFLVSNSTKEFGKILGGRE